jgi:deoxyribodipyrimidine photo-lyase
MATIVWFRQDLRIEDHAALTEAVNRGEEVYPVYIWSPEEEGDWKMGGAQKVWLHFSLKALEASLAKLNLHLTIRSGDSLKILTELIKETKAHSVVWSRRYEPKGLKRDAEIKEALTHSGVDVKSFNSQLLCEPWNILNKLNKPFQVFTPFYKHCISLKEPPKPLPAPAKSKGKKLKSDTLDLLPKIHWDEGIRHQWHPGSHDAEKALREFVKNREKEYGEMRDRPDIFGTSRLSPYLHFGEISPREVYYEAKKSKEAEVYIRQLYWREFAHHLLYYFPTTPTNPLRPEWSHFEWDRSPKLLKAWQNGLTGYPLVDAGMRELWTTGWMHNRVRMVVGSFLIKDLFIHWVEGAKWFWDTLVDADLANNTMGWQWVAGCGADASPYFRIFNPTTQGEKFDPDGKYIRKWVPELEKLEDKYIHEPSKAPPLVLRAAGVTLGKTYPYPIVDHDERRKEALVRYAKLKGE